MTRQKKIYQWNMGRGLIEKGFNETTEFNLLKEELFEFVGVEVKINWFTKILYKLLNTQRKFVANHGTHDQVDALCDIIVVATGSIYKLGYDADKALDETIKEINSRIGSINPKTGKFEKDTSIMAKGLWYKAKYNRCKLDGS